MKLAAGDSEDGGRVQRFVEATGWQLRLAGEGVSPCPASSGVHETEGTEPKTETNPRRFLPTGSPRTPVEQNMAQYCVDQAFEGKDHRVYKKSIRQDAKGKYLELTFHSPEVGMRYSRLL